MLGATVPRSSHSRSGGAALVAFRASKAARVRRLSATTTSWAASPVSCPATGAWAWCCQAPGS
jgi:hypothetical protein